MNKTVLMGRLCANPEIVRKNESCVAKYRLAVDRRYKREGKPDADFIPCVAFNRSAEFAEKYFRKGVRITICGRIQTDSYTNDEGVKIYTMNVVVDEQEFAESKSSSGTTQPTANSFAPPPQGFEPIDDDGELPF